MENLNDAMPRLLSKQISTVKNLPWAEYEFRGPNSNLAVPFDDEGTFVASNRGRDPLRLAYEEVIDVGPGVEGIEVGDLISIPKDHGTVEITVHGYTCTVLRSNVVNCTVCPAAERPEHISAARKPVKMNPKRDRKLRALS